MNMAEAINLDNEQAALAKSIWLNALKIIKTKVSSVLFVTWIEPLVPFYVDENYLFLSTPDDFSHRYLVKYLPLFADVIADSNSFRLEVKLVVGLAGIKQALEQLNKQQSVYSETDSSADREQLSNVNQFGNAKQFQQINEFSAVNETQNQLKQVEQIETFNFANNSTQAVEKPAQIAKTELQNQAKIIVNPLYQQHFRTDYTFANFIVGPNNTMAHAACQAIANSYFKEGQKPYNPLFLYGGSGLGKTHLLNAIGNEVLKNKPQTRILYLQTEDFVNEFIATIRKQNYNVFRNKYRNCDLLLIDDIQFIEGKEQMQEEFFYTFNALYENNAYIVITCDKHPRYLVTLEERLKTRFLSGLACDINPPNYETRMAILQARAQALNENIDLDIINYIAKNISLNIRELEGALNSVLAIKHLSGYVNLTLAEKALEPIIKHNISETITPDFIADVVATYYNIAKANLYSPCKESKYTNPRHVAMYLCRDILNMTYANISKAFNRSDHTTTRNACLKIKKALKNDLALQKEIASIKNSLHEH